MPEEDLWSHPPSPGRHMGVKMTAQPLQLEWNAHASAHEHGPWVGVHEEAQRNG
jgi:hypothetical protein